MRYYLVALFDKDSYSYIEDMQRNMCRKYKIHKNIPMLHITLEVIGDPDIERLNKIISDMLKPYKKFKVEVNETASFEPPYKSVNLRVESKGYIVRLARQINETLKLHGFDVRENTNNLDLHVVLANTNHVAKEWTAKEYVAASESTKKEHNHKMVKIDRIELWKSTNNKREMIIKSFPLREF